MSEMEVEKASVWYLYGAEDGVVRSIHVEEPEAPEGLALLEVPGGPTDGDPARNWWRVSSGMLVQMRGPRLMEAQAGVLADQVPEAVRDRARRHVERRKG
jgi:hypothetical protein